MSTGQAILSVGAIMLLMIISSTLGRTYVISISDTLQQQRDIEAINYSQALTESLFGAAMNYSELDDHFGSMNDVTNPDARFTHVTAFGDTLFATVDLSAEQALIHNVTGRLAEVSVYEKRGQNYHLLATNYATVNQH